MLTRADSLKVLYGVSSDEYLAAFTDAIQEAFTQKNYDIAFRLRTEHSKIVMEKYGSDSFEYGEDMFRLGNVVLARSGEEDALSYYLKAKNAFEESGRTGNEFYTGCLWQIGWCHYSAKNYEAALESRTFLRNFIKNTQGENYFYANVSLALGGVYWSLQNYEKAKATYLEVVGTLKNLFVTKEELERDGMYQDALFDIILLTDNDEEEYERAKHFCEILRNVGDTSSERYTYCLNIEFTYLYDRRDYLQAKQIGMQLNPLVVGNYGDESENYLLFLKNFIDVLYFTFDYDGALQYSEKYGEIVKRTRGSNCPDYAIYLYSKASINAKKGETDKAQTDIDNSIRTADKLKDSKGKFRILADCHNLKGMICAENEPETAIDEFDKAIRFYEKADVSDDILVPIINNYGHVYCTLGDYHSASSVFEKAISILEKSGTGKYSTNGLSLLNNLALCYIYLGKLSEGMQMLDNIKHRIKKCYGEENELYLNVLVNQGLYYTRTFEYQKMHQTFKRASQISEAIEQPKVKTGTILMNLGYAHLLNYQYTEAENTLKTALEIFTETLGSEHKYLAFIYHNLALTYFAENRLEDSDRAFAKSQEIYVKNGQANTIDYIGLMADYGRCLLILHSPESEGYLQDACERCLKLGLDRHPIFLQIMSLRLGASFFEKDSDSTLISETINSLLLQYKENISTFTSGERKTYWSRMSSLKSLLFNARKSNADDIALYDYILISKGLLLGTDVSFDNFLSQIDDETVKSDFKRLQSLRAIINKELTLRKEDRLPNLDSLQEEAIAMERLLIQKSQTFGDYAESWNTDYASVAGGLGKRETAIEFVNYIDFYNEDEMVYAAMITRKGWKKPGFVKLFNESEISGLITRSPNDMYSNSSVGNALYQKIWGPLSRYVRKGDTVYFSPSGMLYKISLESLCNAKGRSLSETYNMIRCSSTKYVCSHSNEKKDITSAILYGGLVYDINPEKMLTLSREYTQSAQPRLYSRSFESSGTRSGWTYLPGTKKEVESLSSLLKKHNVSCTLFEGENGNEESFYSISGKSPGILHIATHGFFIDKEEAKRSDYLMGNTSVSDLLKSSANLANTSDNMFLQPVFASNDDAMIRSGLMLSGGNRAWRNETIPPEIEDGVLTAAEVASMNLQNTDLVVLSACETGLGDVSDEGVLGLQRAFKNAGVETVVMSLWKVDDAATEMMITYFYKYLLSGLGKREALVKAQEYVREKLVDPYYWAAFIMLD